MKRRGRPQTEETKEKIRQARLGVPRKPFTTEHRENISKAQQARREREKQQEIQE